MVDFRHSRPSRLHYRSRDGVYETHFPSDGGMLAFTEFVARTVSWSTEGADGRFALLDTFLSDSMTVELLERVLQAADPAPVKVLLADPTSPFGLARGGSIQQDTLDESIRGLQHVVEALEAVSGTKTGVRAELFRERSCGTPNDDRLRCIREQTEAIAALGPLVDLRFYAGAASGPMYFLGDLVLAGRFGAGRSAIRLPWSLVVKDPAFADDLYGTLEAEFNHLWDHASSEIGSAQQGTARVFLSYSELDRSRADAVRKGLSDVGIDVFMAGHDIGPSESWMDVLRVNLIQCSHVVILMTPAAVGRQWILTEAGAAWALGKAMVPALSGVTAEALPDVIAHHQAVDITTGIDGLVTGIIALMAAR